MGSVKEHKVIYQYIVCEVMLLINNYYSSTIYLMIMNINKYIILFNYFTIQFEKKTSDHENLLFACDNIEAENMSLKETLDLLKNKLEKKDIEIIVSLKEILYHIFVDSQL